MSKKKVSKITIRTLTQYVDGSSCEKVEVTEFNSVSLFKPASQAVIDVSPLVDKSDA